MLEDEFARLPQLKVPKPGLTYGLRVDAFNEKEQVINDALERCTTLS